MKRLLSCGDETTYSAVFADTEIKLQKPIASGGTERTITKLSFPIDFSTIQ